VIKLAREKLSYRDNLERINEVFPTKELLSISEVKNFTGLSRGKVVKMFSFNSFNVISKATLAREMC
jgi:hypothetical protein